MAYPIAYVHVCPGHTCAQGNLQRTGQQQLIPIRTKRNDKRRPSAHSHNHLHSRIHAISWRKGQKYCTATIVTYMFGCAQLLKDTCYQPDERSDTLYGHNRAVHVWMCAVTRETRRYGPECHVSLQGLSKHLPKPSQTQCSTLVLLSPRDCTVGACASIRTRCLLHNLRFCASCHILCVGTSELSAADRTEPNTAMKNIMSTCLPSA